MEENRRDGGVLRACGDLLGCLRAGRLDTQPLRRPLYPDVDPRLQLPVELVRVGAGDPRDRSRAGLCMALGVARETRALDTRQVRGRALLHRTLIHTSASAGLPAASVTGNSREPLLAHRLLLHPGARRARDLAGR